MSSKIKISEKEKEKKKKKKKIAMLALKPKHNLRGIWQKPLKPGALIQLFGSHQLSTRYMGGGIELRKL